MFRSFALSIFAIAALLTAFPAIAAPMAADTPYAQEYHEGYPIVAEGDANDVQAVAVDGNGSVWAGTRTGVYVLAKGTKAWKPVQDEAQAGPTFDLAVDEAGTVWVAAWNGLWRSSGEALQQVAGIEGPIGAVCVGKHGVTCIGPEGLRHVRGGKVTQESIDCAGSFRALAEDPSGDLWIATGNGLYHKAGENLKRYLQPNEIITAMTMDLAYAPGGRLWVGRRGGGKCQSGSL
jgi:ligand-binding sensor domain-containing protein